MYSDREDWAERGGAASSWQARADTMTASEPGLGGRGRAQGLSLHSALVLQSSLYASKFTGTPEELSALIRDVFAERRRLTVIEGWVPVPAHAAVNIFWPARHRLTVYVSHTDCYVLRSCILPSAAPQSMRDLFLFARKSVAISLYMEDVTRWGRLVAHIVPNLFLDQCK